MMSRRSRTASRPTPYVARPITSAQFAAVREQRAKYSRGAPTLGVWPPPEFPLQQSQPAHTPDEEELRWRKVWSEP